MSPKSKNAEPIGVNVATLLFIIGSKGLEMQVATISLVGRYKRSKEEMHRRL